MTAVDCPHDDAVQMIIAAADAGLRRRLAELTEDARLGVRAIAADPAALALLLRADRGASVVTGGELPRARPFVVAARSGGASVVAVLSGRADPADRAHVAHRGVALLRAMPPTHRFQSATAAIRSGLSVWDPDLDLEAPADLTDPVELPLSPRERTVLELAGAGLSNKAVARRLGISPNTVKFHVQAAFAKLGVSSRAEAVMAAIRRGELSV